LLPHLALSRESVLFTYSGVRPLPSASSGSTGGITRRHFLVDHPPGREGLYSVVGGKLTTHRSLAEGVVDKVCRDLGDHAPCRTRDLPFPYSPGTGLEDLREELIRSFGLTPTTAHRLASIYGARAHEIASLAASDPALSAPLADASMANGAEIVWTMENEMALGLSDAVIRRAMAAWTPDLGRAAAEVAARIGQSHLGWTKDRAEDELADFDLYIKRFEAPDTGVTADLG
jgi:glycerol-3-phosphate dehydrogenase